jgi:hypothetical protein
MGLYIHSPIRLHGVVLNYINTGTTLPFFSMCIKLCVKLEKTKTLFSGTIKWISGIQDKLNKISSSDAHVVKQKSFSYFCKSKEFRITCGMACVLEGDDLIDSDDLKRLEC